MFAASDFDLLDLKLDLSVLNDHLEFADEQIKLQSEESEGELSRKLAAADFDPTDPADQARKWEMVDMHKEWVDYVLPRLIVNPFIVSIWAFYESAMTHFAELVREKQRADLDLSDIRGKHLVDRLDKYFHYILKFPVGYTQPLKDELNFLGSLRNAIVHSNGRLRGLKKSYRDSIRNEEIEGFSFSGDGKYIMIDIEYARFTFETVSKHLRLLFDRYRTS